MNKPLVKNRLASFVYEHEHHLNVQPKGMYEAEDHGRQYEYEAGARDDTYKAMTMPGA